MTASRISIGCRVISVGDEFERQDFMDFRFAEGLTQLTPQYTLAQPQLLSNIICHRFSGPFSLSLSPSLLFLLLRMFDDG
jgi:hypothetical protein